LSDDPRGPLFAFLRPYLKAPGFNDPALVEGLDRHLDLLGVPRAQTAAPPSPGIPDDYWPLLAQIESGGRPYIKAPTSSASGLYQFIKQTWIGEGGQWGSDPSQAFGGLRPSEAEQTQRAKTFTQKNADYLKRMGIRITKSSLYAAHFLGAGTAVKILCADIGSRADVLAGPAATNANPSILRGKTVAQFIGWLHSKCGDWAK
jgi:hypothetical protein